MINNNNNNNNNYMTRILHFDTDVSSVKPSFNDTNTLFVGQMEQ